MEQHYLFEGREDLRFVILDTYARLNNRLRSLRSWYQQLHLVSNFHQDKMIIENHHASMSHTLAIILKGQIRQGFVGKQLKSKEQAHSSFLKDWAGDHILPIMWRAVREIRHFVRHVSLISRQNRSPICFSGDFGNHRLLLGIHLT